MTPFCNAKCWVKWVGRLSRCKCVVCAPQPRSLTDVSARGFRVLTPFCNAKCWVKWVGAFHAANALSAPARAALTWAIVAR
ncbi:hypothetical protein DMQ72_21205 [Klebsiella quasipneumoniae]|nr:hypothetical protein DMQ72_21205 [Klebsiella quasipneumoniae]